MGNLRQSEILALEQVDGSGIAAYRYQLVRGQTGVSGEIPLECPPCGPQARSNVFYGRDCRIRFQQCHHLGSCRSRGRRREYALEILAESVEDPAAPLYSNNGVLLTIGVVCRGFKALCSLAKQSDIPGPQANAELVNDVRNFILH